MEAQASAFRGYRRRIRIVPAPGRVDAAVEDDFHHLGVALDHRDGVIAAARTRAVRVPWTTCPLAATFLEERVVGARIESVAKLEDARQHCTHLFDLFLLAAAHARDSEITQYDIAIPDRADGCTRASLLCNGEEVLAWNLDGLTIEAPGRDSGRDMKTLSRWSADLPEQEREHAQVLRRGVLVAGGRARSIDDLESAAQLPQLQAACFTYQAVRSSQARPTKRTRRDFSAQPERLLEGD